MQWGLPREQSSLWSEPKPQPSLHPLLLQPHSSRGRTNTMPFHGPPSSTWSPPCTGPRSSSTALSPLNPQGEPFGSYPPRPLWINTGPWNLHHHRSNVALFEWISKGCSWNIMLNITPFFLQSWEIHHCVSQWDSKDHASHRNRSRKLPVSLSASQRGRHGTLSGQSLVISKISLYTLRTLTRL